MKKNLLSYILLLIFAACKPAVDEKNSGFSFNKPGGAPLKATSGSSMTLLAPATSPNNSSSITLRVNGVVDSEMVKVYNDTTCTNQVASTIASGTTADLIVTGLLVGNHHFSTKSSNSNGNGNCSGDLLLYTYLGAAPTEASAITLNDPASSPASDSTPQFTLSGLVPGETIRLYKNATCTLLVSSAVATSSSLLMTSTALAVGSYDFHSTTTNSAGTSACSSAGASYQYLGVLPSSAATMTLSIPSITPNYVSTPTFVLSNGVAPGDTVKVYDDPTCTNEVGSAVSSGSTVAITLSAQAVGSHTYASKSSNAIGSSACRTALTSYNYLGPSPTVQVSWTANKETAVNMAGGGYKVYYSTTSGFNINTASSVTVPYVAGPTAPISTTISGLLAGTHYFKVVAYSALNPVGVTTGSTSAASAQFSLTLP